MILSATSCKGNKARRTQIAKPLERSNNVVTMPYYTQSIGITLDFYGHSYKRERLKFVKEIKHSVTLSMKSMKTHFSNNYFLYK